MGLIDSIMNFFSTENRMPERVKLSRNEACWCGSGKKYKKCHLHDDEKKFGRSHNANCGPT